MWLQQTILMFLPFNTKEKTNRYRDNKKLKIVGTWNPEEKKKKPFSKQLVISFCALCFQFYK